MSMTRSLIGQLVSDLTAGTGASTAAGAPDEGWVLIHRAVLDHVSGRDVIEVGPRPLPPEVRSAARTYRWLTPDDPSLKRLLRRGHLESDALGDVVLCLDTLQRAWDDVKVVELLSRLVRPGGVLVTSTPNRAARLFARESPRDGAHVREYDEVVFKALLAGRFASVACDGLFGYGAQRTRYARDAWAYYFGVEPFRSMGRLRPAVRPARRTSRRDADVLLCVCREPLQAQARELFDAARFWRMRMNASSSLVETGTNGAPAAWQRWLYRGKVRAYRDLFERAGVSVEGTQVLDFGCGVGFFEDVWQAMGAVRADGIDIVPEVIAQLQAAHPQRHYACLDLASDVAPDLSAFGQPQVVTAIDVLYHITEDVRLEAVLRRLLALVPAGGFFVFSDMLQDHRPAVHVRFRSVNQWTVLLGDLGFAIVDREPVFVLNNHTPQGVRVLPGPLGFAQHTIDHFVRRLFPWLANNWAVVARRQGSLTSGSP